MKVSYCWSAKEYKKGWRLGFSTNKETKWLNVWFGSPKDIKKALGKGCIVFIHLGKDGDIKNART